ncbi:SPASM domain-containing protein, partial [Patescibacteria group bacterium]|nr:SPASM domain-containing protein [Patescibacteria group bacterium]
HALKGFSNKRHLFEALQRHFSITTTIDTKYNFSFMSSGVVRQSLNFFAKWTSESVSKNKTVILYGGEPLLNKEAFCLAIKHMHILKKKKLLPEDLEISVITNGTLIDRNIASFMKDYNVLVGISVDGMPKVNDEYRCFPGGNGSFKKTRTGCETLKSVGVEFSLSITITPSSVKNLLKHVQWLIEKFEPKGIGLNLLMDSAERIISSSEYAEIATKEMIRCFEFLRENGIHENRMMRKIDSFVDKKIYPYDCGGCGRQVVFLPSGEVGMCQAYILSKKFFSIPDSKFSPYTNNDFIGWAKRSPLTMPQCLDCIVLGICGGGCPARADFRHGSILALDDIFCIHAKETLKWMINDLYRYESEEG